jgi:hypothetical protein
MGEQLDWGEGGEGEGGEGKIRIEVGSRKRGGGKLRSGIEQIRMKI